MYDIVDHLFRSLFHFHFNVLVVSEFCPSIAGAVVIVLGVKIM